MDSEDGDCNTDNRTYIYLLYKAYLRIYCKIRGLAFLRFKKVLI